MVRYWDELFLEVRHSGQVWLTQPIYRQRARQALGGWVVVIYRVELVLDVTIPAPNARMADLSTNW